MEWGGEMFAWKFKSCKRNAGVRSHVIFSDSNLSPYLPTTSPHISLTLILPHNLKFIRWVIQSYVLNALYVTLIWFYSFAAQIMSGYKHVGLYVANYVIRLTLIWSAKYSQNSWLQTSSPYSLLQIKDDDNSTMPLVISVCDHANTASTASPSTSW